MSSTKITIWVILLIAASLVAWYRIKAFSDLDAQSVTAHAMPKLVFITGGSGPYWQLTVKGAETAAEVYGVKLAIEMPEDEESAGQQSQLLLSVDPSQIGGLAISPVNAEGQTRMINDLARNVNVVTFDSDAPLSERQCYVGTSNFSAGKMCGRLVREAIPDGGQVAVFLANLTKENLIERKAGFAEAMYLASDRSAEGDEEPSARFDVVDYLVDEGNDEIFSQLIRDTLEKYPEINCMVGMNAHHGPVFLKVLEEEGKLGEIKLVTFDEAEETLNGVEAGHIYATIAQDPYMYGYQAVKILTSLYGGDETSLPIVGRGSIYVGAEAIKQDNLDRFRKSLQDRLAEKPGETKPPEATSETKDAA
jgi:ribose transport system substrate-binding protein